MKYLKNQTYQNEEENLDKIVERTGRPNNNTALALQVSGNSGVMKYQGIVTHSPKIAILARSGQDCIAINTFSPDNPTRNFNFKDFRLYLWAKSNRVYCVIDGMFVDLEFLALFFRPDNISTYMMRFLYFDGSKFSQLVFDNDTIKPIFDLCMNRFYPDKIDVLKDEADNQEVSLYE